MKIHSETITVPVDIQLMEVEAPLGTALVTVSPVPSLTGSGTIRESDDGTGWDVFFQCTTEFPLVGFSHERDRVIEMIWRHLRMVALSVEDGNEHE